MKGKKKGISPAQKAARIRNFSIFRLKGILATLGNIWHCDIRESDNAQEIWHDITLASDAIISAISRIKGEK